MTGRTFTIEDVASLGLVASLNGFYYIFPRRLRVSFEEPHVISNYWRSREVVRLLVVHRPFSIVGQNEVH